MLSPTVNTLKNIAEKTGAAIYPRGLCGLFFYCHAAFFPTADLLARKV